jgi:hypothetical protein
MNFFKGNCESELELGCEYVEAFNLKNRVQ